MKTQPLPAHPPQSERPRRLPIKVLIAIAALSLGGLAARLMPWQAVFTPEGVELVPADSHYYVRFAQLQLASFPRFTQIDPYVNFPAQARIIWPPLHTGFVALAIATSGTPNAEAAAAWVGPLLSLLWLLALGAVALAAYGPAFSYWVVLVLALTPAAIESGALGNADHHVHEAFLQALWVILLGRALELRSLRWAIGAGVALGLARSLTTIGFVWIPLAAAVFPWVAWKTRDARLAWLALATGATATAVLALGAGLLGNLGLPEYELMGSFPVLLSAAAFCLAIAASWGVCRDRRWVFAVPPGLIAAGLAAPQLMRALQHLGARDPLLALVVESQPLWRDPAWALGMLGPLALLVPIALVRLARLVPVHAYPALLSLAVLGVMAATQARFIQPWAGAAAVVVAIGFDGLRIPVIAARLGVVAAIAWLAFVLRPETPELTLGARLRPTMYWIRDNTPASPQTAVLSHHWFGHWVVLWAQRPAVTSTFSQLPWHLDGNQRGGEILAAEDEERAFEKARASRIGFVLATPFEPIAGFPDASAHEAMLARLMETPGTFARFRLVHESAEQRRTPPGGPLARVYEVVSGATLEGPCVDDAVVVATTDLLLEGHRMAISRTAQCQDGRFVLRVSQPSETWQVGDATYAVSLSQVREGARIPSGR